MELELKSIPTVFINLETQKVRLNELTLDLESHGFQDVTRSPATPHKVGYIGLIHSQITAISKMKAPFLLLEDDVKIRNFREIIFVPEDADAIYLGTSGWAMQGNKTTNFLKYSKTKWAGIYKIKNMLSAHAILFVSETFRQECLAALIQNSKNEQLPCDIVLANLQQKFKVYCYNTPIFVQEEYGDAMSDAPSWTQQKLTEYSRSYLVQFQIPLNFVSFRKQMKNLLNKMFK